VSTKSRKSRPVRIREPHLLGFILVATLVIVAGVVSIGETGDAWLVALVVVVMLAFAAALALDVGFAIDAEEEAVPAPAPAGASEIAPVDTTLAPSSDFTGSGTRAVSSATPSSCDPPGGASAPPSPSHRVLDRGRGSMGSSRACASMPNTALLRPTRANESLRRRPPSHRC
jgi:hypothetical protein